MGEICNSDVTKLLGDDKGREKIYNVLSGNGSNNMTIDEYTTLAGILDVHFKEDVKKRLYECTKWTKDARNSINHFGLLDNDSQIRNKHGNRRGKQGRRPNQTYTYDQLNSALQERYDDFLNCMKESGCKLVNEQGEEILWEKWFSNRES